MAANTSSPSWLQLWKPKDFSGLSTQNIATKKNLIERYVRDYIKITNFSNKQQGKPEYKAKLTWTEFETGKPRKSKLTCVLNPVFIVRKARSIKGKPGKGGGPGQISPVPPPDPGK